ncbi:hypothetical protein [Cellulosimicrobium sp. Marseille-Q4280]|uniref:hypothetical protein n=1 Tax=Cellulosimicrobium sp. Marseille-Q4280 TaxID=2937992 RepID=UPI00203C998C|nr:hypothetical protein [Cellulosimicrobium sp. Marseille-Q4280]
MTPGGRRSVQADGDEPRRREGVGGRYERSARFWLRAYPLRWRDAHGDEALGVLLDLAPATDDASSVAGIGAREAWGLVRAGWGLRWREHPTLGRWLLYRLFDARLPARYWWWVADDIHGALFSWRTNVFNMVILLTVWFGVPAVQGWLFGQSPVTFSPWIVLVVMATFALAGAVWRERNVARAWRKHVLDGNIPVAPRRAVEP